MKLVAVALLVCCVEGAFPRSASEIYAEGPHCRKLIKIEIWRRLNIF